MQYPHEVLFKYRDWSNPYHKTILTNYEIFAASPVSFNDPFDCSIPLRYDLLTGKELILKTKKLLKKANPRISNTKLREGAKLHVDNLKSKGLEHLEGFTNHMRNETQNTFGVLSLTEEADNILMWSHYANCHQGFCIGFNTDILLRSTQPITLGPVDYEIAYPIIKPIGNQIETFLKQFFIKAENWRYEKEHRIIYLNKANKVINFDPKAINRIILGCKMNPKNALEIINFVKERLPNLPIYKAKVHPEKFELIFESIN